MNRLVTLALLLLALAGCNGEIIVNVGGAVQGRVTDAVLRVTISGATITIQGHTALTNASGGFFITDLKSGQSNLTVMKSGYQSKTMLVTVLPRGFTDVEIQLHPQ